MKRNLAQTHPDEVHPEKYRINENKSTITYHTTIPKRNTRAEIPRHAGVASFSEKNTPFTEA